MPIGSYIITYFRGFTKFNGPEAVFVISASLATATAWNASSSPTASVNYSLQPKDTSRGDFEDRLGRWDGADSLGTSTGLNRDIGIPEVNLELRSEPIVATTR